MLMKILYTPFFLLLLQCISKCFCQHRVGNDTRAVCELEVPCNGTVADGNELTYYFNVTTLPVDSIIRISVNSSEASVDTPLLLVARMRGGISSWTVPMTTEGRKYNHVSQTLCPALSQRATKPKYDFYLDVSTANKKGLSFTFVVYKESKVILTADEPKKISANPAEPMFLRYKFKPHQERVLVKAESDSKTCGVLVVQNTKCPTVTQTRGEYSGVFATMTNKAGITVESNKIEGGMFYVGVVVKDSDKDCKYQSGRINPFAPSNGHLDEDSQFRSKKGGSIITGDDRVKVVKITVVVLPKIDEYMGPVVAPLLFFGMFYVVAFVVLVVSWCMAEDGGKSFYNYLFPKKVKATDSNTINDGEQSRLLYTPVHSDSHSYGSAAASGELPPVTSNNEADEDDGFDGYDYLDDIDRHKDVYRLKPNLFLSDLSKKPYKKLSKKFNVYYWNLLTVSVFYALPVIQLVLTYQRVVNTSGDQDICYYNFFCARPYHLVSAFNNIYSNVGYMMLGLLFVFLVMRRDRLSKQKYVKDPENEKRYGIPRHYGIMYAMGYALFMEGVMSACYHVCPNYSNFQFDTAFMYIIGILGCLRLYQTRHHDVFLNGHYAFAGFAAVIFTAVIGVIFRSWQFWVIFMIFHCVSCLYLSCQIYYLGRVKTAFKVHWLATRWRAWCSQPIYKVRFVLLLIFNIVNWALSINGLVNVPKDFATYLLGIIICNGLLYVAFYVIMKLRNREKILLLPFVCVVLSIVTWGVSLHFFVQGLTDWQTSPAQSREGNADCKLVGFYDDHDLWHFLSATALFFSFVAILTVDDDLELKDRDAIPVF